MENAAMTAATVAAATAVLLPLNLITRISNQFWPFEMF